MLSLRFLAPAVAAVALLASAATTASAQSFSEPQRTEIQKIVREYLLTRYCAAPAL